MDQSLKKASARLGWLDADNFQSEPFKHFSYRFGLIHADACSWIHLQRKNAAHAHMRPQNVQSLETFSTIVCSIFDEHSLQLSKECLCTDVKEGRLERTRRSRIFYKVAYRFDHSR